MNDSILTSIKKLLGITGDYTHFDSDIIMHINSVFFVLHQLGVGPEDGYSITGDEETWGDYFTESVSLEAVKSYMHLKVKLLFDPPASSAVLEAYNAQIKEFEWRLNVAVSGKACEEGDDVND